MYQPLSGHFSLRDVHVLFESTNRPNDLRSMYTRVIGSVTAGVSSLRDFDGYGRAVVTDNTVYGQQGQNAEIKFHLVRNKLNASVIVEYSQELNDIGTSNSTKTGVNTFVSDGDKTIILPVSPGIWYYRIQWWNAFNNQTVGGRDNTQAQAFEIVPPVLSTPNVIGVTNYDTLNNRYTLQWTISGVQPTGYTGEFRVNGGGWESVGVTEPFSHWNSSITPKTGLIQASSLPNPSDLYEFRIRGTRSGYTISPWSNIVSYQH